jgi:hypothetical protein
MCLVFSLYSRRSVVAYLTHDGISGQRSRTARTHLDTNASSFMPMEAVNCMCHCTSLHPPHLARFRTALLTYPPVQVYCHFHAGGTEKHGHYRCTPHHRLRSWSGCDYRGTSPLFCVLSYPLCLILMRPSPGCRYHYAPPRSPRRSWSTDLVPPSRWMGQRQCSWEDGGWYRQVLGVLGELCPSSTPTFRLIDAFISVHD